MRKRQAPLLAAGGLLLVACRSPERNVAQRHPTRMAQPTASSSPINPAQIRNDVEANASFQDLRKAACPRRVPDRVEEMSPFPAIAILKGLGYATVSDDASRGRYEKVIELTDSGRGDLEQFLQEEAERYVITIARREYIAGSERFDPAPGNPDRLFLEILWRWKPVNALGERLIMWSPDGDGPDHHGRATYDRTSEGWTLSELWLDRNNRDYVGGVYR